MQYAFHRRQRSDTYKHTRGRAHIFRYCDSIMQCKCVAIGTTTTYAMI